MPLQLPGNTIGAVPQEDPIENNILRMLREANLFGPSQPEPQQPMMGQPMGQPPDMGGMEYPAGDRFNEMIGQYPGQDEPGMMTKIAASMIGLNNPQLAMQLMQQPSQAQREWQQQIGPAQAAATNERLTGQGDIRLGQADVRLGQGQQRIDETEAHNRATEAIAKFKIDNPNRRIVTLDDGSIVGINPTNPTDVVDVPGVENLSYEDKQKILQEHRIEMFDMQQAGRKELQGAGITAASKRASDRARDAAVRQQTGILSRAAAAKLAEENRQTRPRGSTRSQADIRTGRVNRATQVLASNPEYEKFISIDGTRVEIKPWKDRSRWAGIEWSGGTGITEAEYNRVVDSIFVEDTGSSTDTTEKLDPLGIR